MASDDADPDVPYYCTWAKRPGLTLASSYNPNIGWLVSTAPEIIDLEGNEPAGIAAFTADDVGSPNWIRIGSDNHTRLCTTVVLSHPAMKLKSPEKQADDLGRGFLVAG